MLFKNDQSLLIAVTSINIVLCSTKAGLAVSWIAAIFSIGPIHVNTKMQCGYLMV
jgi:FtsH-binding integral membrane protein